MNLRAKHLITYACLTFIAACGTSTTRAPLEYTVTSTPSGAMVYVREKDSNGVTYRTVSSSKKGGDTVTPDEIPGYILTGFSGVNEKDRTFLRIFLPGYEYGEVLWVRGQPETSKHFDLQKIPESKLDYGKYPDNYKELIEAFYGEQLKDPESARYRFPDHAEKLLGMDCLGLLYDVDIEAHQGCYSVTFGLNGKNSYGGYTGEKLLTVKIRNGKATDYDDL